MTSVDQQHLIATIDQALARLDAWAAGAFDEIRDKLDELGVDDEWIEQASAGLRQKYLRERADLLRQRAAAVLGIPDLLIDPLHV